MFYKTFQQYSLPNLNIHCGVLALQRRLAIAESELESQPFYNDDAISTTKLRFRSLRLPLSHSLASPRELCEFREYSTIISTYPRSTKTQLHR